MPKQKIKRPSHRYAGPYWVTTRDGKPSVRRYDARMVPATEGNKSSQDGNATTGVTEEASSAAADADRDSAPRTRGQEGLMALALAAGIVRPVQITDQVSAPGPVIEGHNRHEGVLVCADCGGGQFVEKLIRARASSTNTASAATAPASPATTSLNFSAVNSGPPPTIGKITAANAIKFMPVNSSNNTQKAPKAKSSTVATARPAKANPTVSIWKMPKAEADALAESEGKRRCNKCRAARSLECFVRSSVPYGPIKDTHKMCNKCRLGSMGPPSVRPSLDEFGRQFLGEPDENQKKEEDDAEQVDEDEQSHAEEVDGDDDYKSETSLEDYNPEDWMD